MATTSRKFACMDQCNGTIKIIGVFPTEKEATNYVETYIKTHGGQLHITLPKVVEVVSTVHNIIISEIRNFVPTMEEVAESYWKMRKNLPPDNEFFLVERGSPRHQNPNQEL